MPSEFEDKLIKKINPEPNGDLPFSEELGVYREVEKRTLQIDLGKIPEQSEPETDRHGRLDIGTPS